MELEEPLSSGGWHPGVLALIPLILPGSHLVQHQSISFPGWWLLVMGPLRMGWHLPLLMVLIKPVWRAGLGAFGNQMPCSQCRSPPHTTALCSPSPPARSGLSGSWAVPAPGSPQQRQVWSLERFPWLWQSPFPQD